MRNKFAIAAAIAVAIVAWKGPQWLAFERGVKAYLYGYPLITADVSERVMTSPEAQAAHRMGSALVNHLAHGRTFPDHRFTDVVAPNADTLYSIAWLDLSKGPMLLRLPDMHGRWVLMEVVDAWSNAFASLGTRNYGGAERTYALVGPGWSGSLPAGVTRVDSPTNIAWLIGRTYTAGAADYDAVHQVQDQYLLAPLTEPGKGEDTVSSGQVEDKPVDIKTPVVSQVAALGASEYFGRMAQLMKDNPPAAADAPMRANLAALSIEPGKAFRFDALSASQQRGLEDAVWFVRAMFDARAPGTQGDLAMGPLMGPITHAAFGGVTKLMNKMLLNVRNGWMEQLNLGAYGTNYPLRAIVTLLGYGANVAADAVYPMTTVDADGQKLDGANRYRLHFDKAQLPPAKAFWSLTMYNEKGFFIANPIGRYAIGDRDPMQYNEDGSLDILVQTDSPGVEHEANWLPAPSGPFKLALRLYEPKPEVLNGNWVPSAVQRTAAH
ncbi:MAG: DUF1254 domain-containing protein [Burkholderiaceae bacterium]|nr:DUF1254 domain-containing protein [Burkholderiaceae bacterium]